MATLLTAAQATPATPSAAVSAMSVDWPMIEALLGGTGAIRQAGKLYLPQAVAESEAAYRYRTQVSTLFNGLRRTVETLSGKPFSEPLKLGDDVPKQIVDYAEDIDLEGRNLQAFAHGVLRTVLSYGLSHILVDYPPTPQGQLLADQRTSGARPYFVHVKPWPYGLLGWRSERIDGVETLTQLRIMETVTVPNGDWANQDIQQVRVQERDNIRLFRQDSKNQWVLFDEMPVSLGLIPLVTVYGERTGFMTARSPLLDLAWLNLEHWQSSSDQSNILHIARVPILFAAGWAEGTTIKIGAGLAVPNDDPTAKLEYVEHSGKAIEAGRASIKDLEERMSLMGAQLLVRRPGSRTATEKAIDTAESDSTLSAIALNLEDALEQALGFVAKWDGLPSGGTIELCHDYSGEDQPSVQDLLKARELGVISAETTFSELQRLEIVSDELTWEEELAKLKAEGPPAGVIGNFETQIGSTGVAPPGAA